MRAFIFGVLLFGFSQFGFSQVELIGDGSFESGTPNSSWNEYSSNFGTPLCIIGDCGTGNGTGPRTGDWWVWFGGISAAEIGSVDQTLIIPVGFNELHFWLENSAFSGSGSDFLQVQIDDVVIATIYEGNPAYANYAEVVLDISAYANGNSHNIEFYAVCHGAGTTNFFVDDVSIIKSPVTPVSWISVISVFLILAAFVVYRFIKSKSLILNK